MRSGAPAYAPPSPSALARLLEAPRYEVIPVHGIEDKVAALSPGTAVTVTASPSHGLDRTVDVSTALAARGYRVTPHIAARMVTGRAHLERLVERLGEAGIRDAFVIGGDADPPVGAYADAGALLDDLAGMPHPFANLGVGGHPEGHPSIGDEQLLEALRRKDAYASYLVTQLCFDSGVLMRWVRMLRDAGIGLPVIVGLPGVVERRKLAEISLRTGVGASLRYLRGHARELAVLARSRRYDPGPLAESVAAHLDDPGAGLAGAHLFTFNQVEATRDWVLRSG